MGEDVGVGDLVERHEHGAERGVHGRADEQCAEQFHRAERSPHGGGHLLQSERLCEEGHARSEDLHGGRDPYAEESPHHGAGQQSEAGFVVASGLDAQADRLAGGREDAELQESQKVGVCGVAGRVGVVECRTQEEWGEQGRGAREEEEIGGFHGFGVCVRVFGCCCRKFRSCVRDRRAGAERVSPPEQDARLLQCRGGDFAAREHLGDLLHACLVAETGDARVAFAFAHHEVGFALRGDLRQVGDVHHLHRGGQLADDASHGVGDAARDARVDLVEDDRRQLHALGEQRLDRQHHAR